MNKYQGIDAFWSGFGIPAYDEHTVPPDATMPYITYSVSVDSMGVPVSLPASLWYRATRWDGISQKAQEIEEAVYRLQKPLEIDGGYLWIYAGNPFAQRMSDETDDSVRRMYINCTAEYLTAY